MCVCAHTICAKIGVIERARTHINLGQITIMNQIYSEAHSHDYFEPSFTKISSLFKKIQIKWQNVLLPIRKAPLWFMGKVIGPWQHFLYRDFPKTKK